MMTYVHRIIFKMRRISVRSCRDDQNTHLMFSNLFVPENVGFFWDSVVKIRTAGRPHIAIQYGACALLDGWLRVQTRTRVYNTHCLLWKHALVLRYMYVACVVRCLPQHFSGGHKAWHPWSEGSSIWLTLLTSTVVPPTRGEPTNISVLLVQERYSKSCSSSFIILCAHWICRRRVVM